MGHIYSATAARGLCLLNTTLRFLKRTTNYVLWPIWTNIMFQQLVKTKHNDLNTTLRIQALLFYCIILSKQWS